MSTSLATTPAATTPGDVKPFRRHSAPAGVPVTPHATVTHRAGYEARKADTTSGQLWTSDGLLSNLAAEWTAASSTTRAVATTRAWAETTPALRDYTHAGQILDDIDRGDAATKDAKLGALIGLAQNGDTLAARTVLQAMLPKLTHLARYADISRDREDDRGHIAVDAFLATVRRYPLARRPHGIAGNLALDTLHAVTRTRRSAPTFDELPVSDVEAVATEMGADLSHPEDGPNAATELHALLTWAATTGVVSAADADLLAAVFSPEPDQAGGHQAVAAARGMTAAAVRQRCSRATRSIRTAVLDAATNAAA